VEIGAKIAKKLKEKMQIFCCRRTESAIELMLIGDSAIQALLKVRKTMREREREESVKAVIKASAQLIDRTRASGSRRSKHTIQLAD
jgi:uncharacterized protein YueI